MIRKIIERICMSTKVIFCHRHTNRGLRWSTDDGATSEKLKKLGTTKEHEDRDEGDKVE